MRSSPPRRLRRFRRAVRRGRCGSRHGRSRSSASDRPPCAELPGSGRDDHETRAAIMSKTMLKRFAQPGEIVKLAALLASDRASYITGATYAVDGGASSWRSRSRHCLDR
ncbi:SDR family oxidoreductase [Streptomyces sp. NPDC048643]|uniref:SDR family oxidoreductase n=1 Tax=Streptomyces sp. NPDC048643 TaxID=3155637 RepID=UPI003435951F